MNNTISPTNNIIETTPRFTVVKGTTISMKYEGICSVCHKSYKHNTGYSIFEYDVIVFGFTCSERCSNMLILQNI